MTTGAGPFTSLVSAHDAPPLLQTNRNATAIFDKDAVCIEFLPSGIHDPMLSSREIFSARTAAADACQMACFTNRRAIEQRGARCHQQSRADIRPGRPRHPPWKQCFRGHYAPEKDS